MRSDAKWVPQYSRLCDIHTHQMLIGWKSTKMFAKTHSVRCESDVHPISIRCDFGVSGPLLCTRTKLYVHTCRARSMCGDVSMYVCMRMCICMFCRSMQ